MQFIYFFSNFPWKFNHIQVHPSSIHMRGNTVIFSMFQTLDMLDLWNVSKCSLPKISIDVFQFISMLSITSSCVIYVRLLFIYFDMKYVWTCYYVNKILVVCHCYDKIFVLVWVVINLNNLLAREHAHAAFGSTKSICHVNVSLLKQLKSFCLLHCIIHLSCLL